MSLILTLHAVSVFVLFSYVILKSFSFLMKMSYAAVSVVQTGTVAGSDVVVPETDIDVASQFVPLLDEV